MNNIQDDLIVDLKEIDVAKKFYVIPIWSKIPNNEDLLFQLESIKEGTFIKKIHLDSKAFYVFGRNENVCDVTLSNLTVSRIHCALQYRGSEGLFIYDLGSIYGTFLNGQKIEKKNYVRLKDGDAFWLGKSKMKFFLNQGENFVDFQEDILFEKNHSDIPQNNHDQNKMLNNESNWGLQEFDNEINEFQSKDDNKNEIFFKKIKERVNLSQNQKEFIKQINKIEKEQEELLQLKERITLFENEENKNKDLKKKIYIINRLDDIENKKANLKEKLYDSISSTENKEKFSKSKLKEYSIEEDNDFYDRTKIEQERDKTKVETYDTVKIKLESLLSEKQRLLEKKNFFVINKEKINEEQDILDKYFAENIDNNNEKNIEKELFKIEQEIHQCEELLKFISPLQIKTNQNSFAKKEKLFKFALKPSLGSIFSKKTTTSVVDAIKNFKKIENIAVTEEDLIKQRQNKLKKEIEESNNKLNSNEIEIDEDYFNKIKEYENFFQKKEIPKEKFFNEKNLFQEIVENIGNQNFEIKNYPRIINRKINKRKREKISLPNEEEYLKSFEKSPKNLNKNNIIEERENSNIDIFKDKSYWKESSVSENPFKKYFNNNE